ncbi:MAG: DUF4358 domain-containing protein [Lachnospiraceae bacterium]|nr:DUF4358 domain-containing protein [Lachnospiraceae bacterium]
MPEETRKQTADKIVYVLLLLVLTASVVLFVRSRLQEAVGVPYDLDALREEIMASGLLEEAQPGSEASIRRNYDLLPSAYGEALHIAPRDFMSVEEIIIVRLDENSDAESILNAFTRRTDNLKQTFENYGTDQFDLLNSCLRYENDLYLVSVTGHQASRLMEMIRSRIER